MDKKVMMITGTRKGIGKEIAEYYLKNNYFVIGCSRGESAVFHEKYRHYCLNVADEEQAKKVFIDIRKEFGQLNVLINNAGIASMNHSILTNLSTVKKVFETNVFGMFLFSREAAKLMRKASNPRIINFSTVAVPLRLEGEAVYAASKAAVNSLTRILSKEFAGFGITVNAIGPTPVKTDLIKNVPEEKILKLIDLLPIKRLGKIEDIINVIEFFLRPESEYITGQVIYLGGVS